MWEKKARCLSGKRFGERGWERRREGFVSHTMYILLCHKRLQVCLKSLLEDMLHLNPELVGNSKEMKWQDNGGERKCILVWCYFRESSTDGLCQAILEVLRCEQQVYRGALEDTQRWERLCGFMSWSCSCLKHRAWNQVWHVHSFFLHLFFSFHYLHFLKSEQPSQM